MRRKTYDTSIANNIYILTNIFELYEYIVLKYSLGLFEKIVIRVWKRNIIELIIYRSGF